MVVSFCSPLIFCKKSKLYHKIMHVLYYTGGDLHICYQCCDILTIVLYQDWYNMFTVYIIIHDLTYNNSILYLFNLIFRQVYALPKQIRDTPFQNI